MDRHAVAVVALAGHHRAEVVELHIGDRPVRAIGLRRLHARRGGHRPVAPVVIVLRHPVGHAGAGVGRLLRQVAVAHDPEQAAGTDALVPRVRDSHFSIGADMRRILR